METQETQPIVEQEIAPLGKSVEIVNKGIKVNYLSAFLLLIPIIIAFCLIVFTSFGAWKIFGITAFLIFVAGIIIYHNYIMEEFDKLETKYKQGLHEVHDNIHNKELALRNDLSQVINDMLSKANEEFTNILTQIHNDIHGKENQVDETINETIDKRIEETSNKVQKEIKNTTELVNNEIAKD